jgi:hypothetical protein
MVYRLPENRIMPITIIHPEKDKAVDVFPIR